MVVFDATTLMLAIRPESGRPIDSETGEPIEHAAERIAFLIAEMDKSKTKIGIPTPALSEVLVRAGSGAPKIVERIGQLSVFQVLNFDEMSAIEVAMMTKVALDSGDKRDGSDEVWAKIKYDRQIIGIARRARATAIYTDDRGLRNTAVRSGFTVIRLADLQLPPEKAQGELPLIAAEPEADIQGLEEIDEVRQIEAGQPTA